MYILYILQCADDTLYTGITNDLEKRLKSHHSGTGAKYTRGRGPFTLLHSEIFPDKSTALKHELVIKSLSRKEKFKYISEYKNILVYAFSSTGEYNISCEILKNLYHVDTFVLNCDNVSVFKQDLDRMIDLIKIKKYSYIIGIGKKPTKSPIIKVEKLTKNIFKGGKILEQGTEEYEIVRFVTISEGFENNTGIGNSWCNYSSYYISSIFGSEKLAFLHVSSNGDKENLTRLIAQLIATLL